MITQKIDSVSQSLIGLMAVIIDNQVPDDQRRQALAAMRNDINGLQQLQLQYQSSGQADYDLAIADGVTITSTSAPALSGTYGIDTATIQNILAQQISIQTRQMFTNGQTSRQWPDVNGQPHTFATTAQFTSFAEAIGQYVDALANALAVCTAGGGWVPPTTSLTIP